MKQQKYENEYRVFTNWKATWRLIGAYKYISETDDKLLPLRRVSYILKTTTNRPERSTKHKRRDAYDITYTGLKSYVTERC